MEDFITIAIFTLPSEMVIAKARLESEDIRCRVLDELTVQSYNFLSNAIGGIKLQVLSRDLLQAKAILEEGGFISDVESEPSYWEKKLHNPATIKRIKLAFLILFGIIFFIVVLALLYF